MKVVEIGGKKEGTQPALPLSSPALAVPASVASGMLRNQ